MMPIKMSLSEAQILTFLMWIQLRDEVTASAPLQCFVKVRGLASSPDWRVLSLTTHDYSKTAISVGMWGPYIGLTG